MAIIQDDLLCLRCFDAVGWVTGRAFVGLGRFGFFKFGSIRFSISNTRFRFFSVSVFAHHCKVHNEGARSGGVSELEFNVPFQHKHGYIRDESTMWVKRPKDLKLYTLLHRQLHAQTISN